MSTEEKCLRFRQLEAALDAVAEFYDGRTVIWRRLFSAEAWKKRKYIARLTTKIQPSQKAI